ncbi:MAG: hypothetical protein M1490_00420 [Candidatus Bathyarchaeota archaeon]|nr:hypothetical protein [Candidatus Bathyarchaeota archaeon]
MTAGPIATVETQADGRFMYNWVPVTGGAIAIQASWLGNRQYNGATSAQTNVIVLPVFLVLLIVVLVLVVVIFAIAFAKIMCKKTALSTQPLETVPFPL